MTPNDPSVRPLRRVLIVNPVAGLGGAERALLDLIGSVRSLRPDVAFHVVLFKEGPLRAAAEKLGASVSTVPLPARLHALGDSGLLVNPHLLHAVTLLWSLLLSLPRLAVFVVSLRSEIASRKVDVVHTNGMKAHLLSGLATPSGLPLVWHLHDFLSERPLASHFLKLIAHRVSAAIAISEAVASDARRVLPSLPITTILNALDAEEFAPGPADSPGLDRLAGIQPAPVGTIRIGLIATYARWKGQDVFLRAGALLRRLMPAQALRLYVVGGPIYDTGMSQFTTAELNALISEVELQGTAGLIPFQNDIVPILRSFDIVVHASTRREPFGRSIIEAMACERAVIVASAGGASEIVQDQLTGLTHNPGDINGLARALRTIIESEPLRRRLAAEGRRSVVAKFSRDRLGRAVLALYQSLLTETLRPSS
jgi:glycosyltransferase involved in cell wall biosynthesis